MSNDESTTSTSYEHEVEASYENNSSGERIKANNPAAQSSASSSGSAVNDGSGFVSGDPRNPQGMARNAALGNKGFKNRADLGDNSEAKKEDALNRANNSPENSGNNPATGGNNDNSNAPGGQKQGPGLDKKPDGLSGGKNTPSSKDLLNQASAVHKNPLPGAAPPSKKSPNGPGNPDSSDQSKKNDSNSSLGKSALASTGIGKKLSGAKQALGMGKGNKKDGSGKGDGEGEGSGFNPMALINGAKSFVFTMKVQLVVAGLFLIIIFAFILSVGTGVPVGVAIGSNGCDQPSYSANSANATEFMCNMFSPFGSAADGKEYSVSSTSGKRIPPKTSTGYGSNFHKGTDVTGPGSDIYAVADGEVVSAEYSGGWGNQVLIKHVTTSTTFYTRYAHLSTIIASKGAVKAGDKIGVMGSTGNSSGPHLHFELLDENKEYVSANPFFGYSDQGYEGCLTPNGDTADSKCDFGASGSARYIGQAGFAQICGKTTGSYVATSSNSNSSSNNDSCCGTLTAEKTGGESGDMFGFISTFEGGTGKSYTCKTSDGQDGYKAYQNAGDKVTVGPGITTDYIKGMKAGDCISKSEVKAGYEKAEKSKRNFVKSKFSGSSLSNYQEDAMVSMAYNGCAGFFDNMAKAVKDDNLADLWKSMKDCTNNGLLGLKRRRKAEFALFVTGDYSLAGAYKSKNWSDVEYDFYDSDGILAKKASGSSSTTCGDQRTVGGYSTTDIVKLAQKEYENWQSFSNDQKRERVATQYMPACGYGTKNKVDDYCAAFVSFLLKETGNIDKVGAGVGNKCIASNWKNSTGGTFHKVGSSYTPKPGDLAIYSGHVEIVEKVEGNMVTTISGNSSPFNVSGGNYPGKTVGNVVRKTPFRIDSNVDGYLSY